MGGIVLNSDEGKTSIVADCRAVVGFVEEIGSGEGRFDLI